MDFLLTPFTSTRAILVGMMAGLLCGVMGLYYNPPNELHCPRPLPCHFGSRVELRLGINYWFGDWGLEPPPDPVPDRAQSLLRWQLAL